MFVSCTSQDDVVPEDPEGVYHFDLVINVGQEKGMRMANEVIQAEGTSFRGLQSLTAIPFSTEGAITADDQSMTSSFSRAVVNRIDGNNYHYYLVVNCSFARNTNHLLVYAQAFPAAGYTTDAQNGKLIPVLSALERQAPSSFSFSLQPIRETTEVHEDAQALADYLTAIANTDGWSTTTNSQLKALYLDFIHADSKGSGLIPGSAAQVKAYVADLKTQLQPINNVLSNAIIAQINNNSSIADNKYPSSLGLPDGTTALRWTTDENGKNVFSVRTQTTTLDNINSINRYTYPAELWYYANSAIRTSTEEVAKSIYEDGTKSGVWETLLANNYKGSRYVTGETKSVAIEEPLQYGVARLQMTLKAITENPLRDSKDATVTYSATNGFKLTGVIIGGQHTVGFDFKPKEPQSDVDARFIYDTEVGDHKNNAAITVNTLVLQSYDEEKVPVILEFENQTGKSFNGKDGIIYPNTKFYLIGQLDPAGKGEGACANRVFTQDYTTAVAMTIKSLANAYSCMPDLLEPRLEIGVEVQTQWIQSTTTIVKL